jgi:hypothetical protein
MGLIAAGLKGSNVAELKLSFVEETHNIVLAGTSGLDKTMIARNIAWKAAIAPNLLQQPGW